MNKALDSKLLKKFLTLAGGSLAGEWVLIGGTVLPALGVDCRATVDIDLASLSQTSADQTLKLMEIAENLGLAVESINQAGAYFLKKTPHTKNDLVLLAEGKKASIYRPTATLYLILKIKRLSASDLEDCLEMIKFAKKNKEKIDSDRVFKEISRQEKLYSEQQLARAQLLSTKIKKA